MAYTAEKAILDAKRYLNIVEQNLTVIENTKNRGYVVDLDGEKCVVFLSPISCKQDGSQAFVDTRSSGPTQRMISWNYAVDNNYKFFHLAINDEQEIFRNYFLSIENSENFIQGISGFNSHGTRTTQANFPNEEKPSMYSQKIKRITTDKDFNFAVVHKDVILEYLKFYDNRPYRVENNEITNAEVDRLLVKLPNEDKYCAQRIIDCLYDYDRLGKLLPYFSNPGTNTNDEEELKYLKIDTDIEVLGLGTGKNLLKSLFILPASKDFEYHQGDWKQRYVSERIYTIQLEEKTFECKLTGEWVGTPIEECKGKTNINALIQVVNYCYRNEAEIVDFGGGGNKKLRYLIFTDKRFTLPPVKEYIKDSYIDRFVSSLLAKPFVILTGNSGTGKTRIANQFSRYLEVVDDNQEKNSLLVSVGADWTDNTKVLGYYNPLVDYVDEDGECKQGKYEESDILKFIIRANENPDIPYFLILDEMNLSHVERYFSDFLSHMEIPDNPFKIDGHESIKYPKNLFVVGTVNIDETTYMFSPKVLDRANVIEYKPDKDSVLALFAEKGDSATVYPANNGSAEAFMVLANKVRYSQENEVGLKGKFEAIYEKLDGSGFEFAFRTVAEIKKYFTAAKELQGTELSEEQLKDLIDEQLVQKILPKIHGNQKEIGELLNALKTLCQSNGYELSETKINEMIKKLGNVHYASFI